MEAWADYVTQENSLGEIMPLLSHVSRLDLIGLSLHTAPGLVALSILWVLFFIALVYACIQLISWETAARGTSASSMVVLRLESGSAGSTGRRPFLYQRLQYDDWSSTLAAGRFNLKYETLKEDYNVRSSTY